MRRTLTAALVLVGAAGFAHARPPNGLGVVRTIGSRGSADVLVAIPSGTSARDLGLREVAPGIARLDGTAADLVAFGAAHPNVHVEYAPRLHTLLANAQTITRVAAARFQRGANGL